MPCFEDNKGIIMVVGGLLVVGIGILVIVLPMSFSTLEYHEVRTIRGLLKPGTRSLVGPYPGLQHLVLSGHGFHLVQSDPGFK